MAYHSGFAPSGDLAIHFEVHGQGKPLVLVHVPDRFESFVLMGIGDEDDKSLAVAPRTRPLCQRERICPRWSDNFGSEPRLSLQRGQFATPSLRFVVGHLTADDEQ